MFASPGDSDMSVLAQRSCMEMKVCLGEPGSLMLLLSHWLNHFVSSVQRAGAVEGTVKHDAN
jgi:hypothetical protein